MPGPERRFSAEPQPTIGRARCRLLARRGLLLGQPLEVLVDRAAIMRRVVAIQDVLGAGLSLGRQRPPAGLVADILVRHVPRSGTSPDRAVLGRTVGLVATTRATAAAGSRAALLFELLDDRVKRRHDLVFFLLHPLTTAAQVQPSFNVLHLP